MAVVTKTCANPGCGRLFAHSDKFGGASKFQIYCNIKCKRAAYQIRNAESIRGFLQRWKVRNADKVKAARHLERRFGLTRQEYADRLKSQGGVCAICFCPETRRRKDGRGRATRLCVDHSHITGRVRALLCHSCNSAIGHLDDDPLLLRLAADYIERHRKESK